jgi:hypothetical protein
MDVPGTRHASPSRDFIMHVRTCTSRWPVGGLKCLSPGERELRDGQIAISLSQLTRPPDDLQMTPYLPKKLGVDPVSAKKIGVDPVTTRKIGV